MKYSPLLLLAFLTTVQAEDNAVRLNCPTRGNITISFFNYHLITMKWGDHFQVAAGKERNHTKAGVAFWSTTFGNGDDLAFSRIRASTICFMPGRKIRSRAGKPAVLSIR